MRSRRNISLRCRDSLPLSVTGATYGATGETLNRYIDGGTKRAQTTDLPATAGKLSRRVTTAVAATRLPLQRARAGSSIVSGLRWAIDVTAFAWASLLLQFLDLFRTFRFGPIFVEFFPGFATHRLRTVTASAPFELASKRSSRC
jgi:hypothetical protein